MRLHFLTILLLGPAVRAGQHVFLPETDTTPSPLIDDALDAGIHARATTTIDILSSSSDHSTFLHLLQRTKLIPTLNLIQGSSIFAPTDEAWRVWGEAQEEGVRAFVMNEPEAEVADNILFGLRQHLLYHIMNYTLPDAAAAIESNRSYVTTETTLLFPNRPIMPPSPHKPPTGSPWLPQGGDGDLGGAGQQLRIRFQEGLPNGAGCDVNGSGGADVWHAWPVKKPGRKGKDDEVKALNSGKTNGAVRYASNGIVIGLQQVLEPPPSIAKIISQRPELSYLSGLLGDDELSLSIIASDSSLPSLAQSRHLTFFAPSDDAFRRRFDPLELKYLESDWGYEGIRRVLAHYLVSTAERGRERDVRGVKGVVGWRSSFEGKTHSVSHRTLVLDLDRNPLNVQIKAGKMNVNGTHVSTPDIFASNGVVHVIDTLLLPDDFKLLNSPEKLLLSLNATRFVSLLRLANLSETYTARHSDRPYTFLAPTDDVLERMERWAIQDWDVVAHDAERAAVSARDGYVLDMLKEQILYHILPGKLSLKELENGALLETELAGGGLAGGRQRIKVDVGPHEGGSDAMSIGDIKIGDGVLTAEPVETGNSIVYLINTLLEPPSDVIQTAVSDLSLSTFVASTFAAGLDKFVKRAPSKTYLAPQNKAFEQLGLVMNYLLLPDAKPDLKKLIRYHIVDEVSYLHDFSVGNGSLKTVLGEKVYWNRRWRNESNPANVTDAITVYGTEYQVGNASAYLPANGDGIRGNILAGNMLTSTGALHSINRVLLPANLDITVGKLVAGAKISTMVDLLIRAKMEWVLTGQQPTEETGIKIDSAEDATPSAMRNRPRTLLPAYTLLCPTDHAFSKINLTYYRNNEVALVNLLKLHLIPSDRVISSGPTSPPQNGKPLTFDEEIAYPTLHSADSAYGDLVVRNIIDDEWMVGVKDARGQSQDHNAGRVLSWGRATPRWRRSSDLGSAASIDGDASPIDANLVNATWKGIMTLGGGVVVIDNVLVPYEPSWFFRRGRLAAILAFVGLLTLGLIALALWFWKVSRSSAEAKYEVLEGEEEE